MCTKMGGMPTHNDLLRRGLRLSIASVAWGSVSAGVAITAGLLAGSLGVLGVGLNVVAPFPVVLSFPRRLRGSPTAAAFVRASNTRAYSSGER